LPAVLDPCYIWPVPILAFASPAPPSAPRSSARTGLCTLIEVSLPACVAIRRIGGFSAGQGRLTSAHLPLLERLRNGLEFDAELRLLIAALEREGEAQVRVI
jgi:hypothetical protein